MGKLLAFPIAFILVLAGPIILWNAESQNRAGDFESAKLIEASSEEDGYVRVKGTPNVEEDVLCPDESSEEKSCLYVKHTLSEYILGEKEVCRATKPTEGYIRELDREECNSDGENCKPCYAVEEKKWEVQDTTSEFGVFSIGEYEVDLSSKANIIGEEEYTKFMSKEGDTEPASSPVRTKATAIVGDKISEYQYIPSSAEILVVGDASEGVISKGDKEYVVSTLSYGQTLEKLKGQDNAAKWGLRIASLAMVVLGFVMFFSALAAIPGMFVGLVPMVGDSISKAFTSIASFIGGMAGCGAWVLMFIVIILLKNIVALLIGFGIIAAVAIGAAYLMNKKKAKK